MAVVGKGFAVFEKRQVPHKRFSCLAGLGRNASPVPGAVQAPRECVSAMNYGPNLRDNVAPGSWQILMALKVLEGLLEKRH